VPKDRNDDPVSLTLDLLNPKINRFRHSAEDSTTVLSFKSLRSAVFVLSC